MGYQIKLSAFAWFKMQFHLYSYDDSQRLAIYIEKELLLNLQNFASSKKDDKQFIRKPYLNTLAL